MRSSACAGAAHGEPAMAAHGGGGGGGANKPRWGSGLQTHKVWAVEGMRGGGGRCVVTAQGVC